MPGFAVFNADEPVCAGMVSDGFLHGIPNELVPAPISDVAQMRHRRNVMAKLEVEHWLSPRLHAIEEVANMRGPRIAAALVLRRIQVRLAFLDHKLPALIIEEDRS